MKYKAGPSLSRSIGASEVIRYGKGKSKVEREEILKIEKKSCGNLVLSLGVLYRSNCTNPLLLLQNPVIESGLTVS